MSNIPGIDANTTRRLRRGQIKIDAKLDLHGMFRDTARQAVLRAVERGYERGQRCLLVITGKGEVLRAGLPDWLADARHVLTYREARPEHGGAGAFYVLLRRRRGRA